MKLKFTLIADCSESASPIVHALVMQAALIEWLDAHNDDYQHGVGISSAGLKVEPARTRKVRTS